MTDEESEKYGQWKRKCDTCEDKYPWIYLRCGRRTQYCSFVINVSSC